MSAIAIIPARGGSVRIPRKNIRLFHGRPIIAYSIQAALESKIFDEVIVSTDNQEIWDVAARYGAEPRFRPMELADDKTGTQEVMAYELARALAISHRLNHTSLVCCIYPCAPMLTATTLLRAARLQTEAKGYVVPVGTWLRDPGQFYMGRAGRFLFEEPLISPTTMICPIDPATDCDINIEEDWQRAERMYADLQEKQLRRGSQV